MLWIKALHVIFMVTWFAGLFYLPRLFVYHTEAGTAEEQARFCTMERKLYAIMSIGMAGTWLFGLWLIATVPGYLQMGWLHAKITLAVLLTGYHHWLMALMRRLREHPQHRSARFYRIINEVPAVFLVAMVILVIVKPF
jgi:putative membrane protein